ncbi:MAG TPA: hypothetical protein VHY08_01290 [Bacillota bacterium]|nr:hypothetical protein [Bacillota bacterium]
MKYTTKIYNISLILIITLIIGILSSEAKKVPLTQLSAPASSALSRGSQAAVYLPDIRETDTSMTITPVVNF